MQVRPALLEYDKMSLIRKLENLIEVTDEFDIDIIAWDEMEPTIDADTSLEQNFEAKFSYDLMDEYPMQYLDRLLNSKRVTRVIINMRMSENLMDMLTMIKAHDTEAGLSMSPEHDLQDLQPYLQIVDAVQIMTIEPGVQGNEFMPERLELVKQIRDTGYKGIIGLDGGINKKTIAKVKDLDIDFISVGSAITKAEDPAAAYNELVELLK